MHRQLTAIVEREGDGYVVSVAESHSCDKPDASTRGKVNVSAYPSCGLDRKSTFRNKNYVSLCPELDIASQGNTIEEARDNLREALELFFETASPDEIGQRIHEDVYVTRLEIGVG